MKVRQVLTAAGVVGVLLLAGCSDDGDSTDGATTPEAAADDELTEAERDAFLAALVSGTGMGEGYIACAALKVRDAAEAGDLTAQELRDWTEGRGVEGPVQAFLTTPDLVTECTAADAASETTDAG